MKDLTPETSDQATALGEMAASQDFFEGCAPEVYAVRGEGPPWLPTEELRAAYRQGYSQSAADPRLWGPGWEVLA